MNYEQQYKARAMQQTSLLAYHEYVKPTLPERQQAVFSVIYSMGPITNKEVAARLMLDPCQVTGRTNELVKKGLVGEACKRRCKITGKTAIAWRVI